MAKKKNFIYNRKNPPYYGELTIEDFEKLVDVEDFPVCDCCGQPIFNPEIYDDPQVMALGMCGPCLLGEADTIMIHRDND